MASLVLYVWRKIVFDGQMWAGIAHLPTNTHQLQWSEKQGADMSFLGGTDTEQRCTLEEYIEPHQPTWATAEPGKSGRRYMFTLTCNIMMPFDLLPRTDACSKMITTRPRVLKHVTVLYMYIFNMWGDVKYCRATHTYNWINLTSKYIQSNFLNIWATSWEKQRFAYAKTKTQISFAVSTFVFATWIVRYLYFLNLKLKASSHL